MAFKIGTAPDHWGLLYDLVDFMTTDTALVNAGHNWALEVGQFSDQVAQYINGTAQDNARSSEWSVQCAMGDDNYWADDRKGWSGTQGDMPNGDAYIGFEAKASIRPTYYKLRTPFFDESQSTERAKAIATWDIQYSDDGSTWVTLQSDSWDTSKLTSEEEQTFQMPIDNNDADNKAPRKYWRLIVRTNGGDSSWCQLGRLRFYDSGDNWVSYRNGSHYVVRGPGLDGNSQIYVHLMVNDDKAKGDAWLATRAYRAWDGTQEPDSQTLPCIWLYTNLWTGETPYWFIVNGQRFIVAAKISTTYSLSYNGKFYPYGTPTEYPYPVIASGHDDYMYTWTRSDGYNQSIQCAGDGTQIFTPQNDWRRHRMRKPASGEAWGRSETGDGYVYCFHSYYYGFGEPNLSTSGAPFRNVLPNADGSVTTFPYILFQQKAPVNGVLGELDGIRFVYGFGVASEDIITIDGTDHIVIQNAFRTDPQSYCVVELK